MDVPANQTHSNNDSSTEPRYQNIGTIVRRYSWCIEEICQGCTEEVRQQQVYEALKQDLAEWAQIDAGRKSLGLFASRSTDQNSWE